MSVTCESMTAVLEAVVKMDYECGEDITEEKLREVSYPHLSVMQLQHILEHSRKILKSIAVSDMDGNQLEAFLTSLTKKRDGSITEDQAKEVATFWRTHRQRIHDRLVQKSRWNPGLSEVTWQADMRTCGDRQMPITVFQLSLEDPLRMKSEMVLFEANQSTLGQMVDKLHEIDVRLKMIAEKTI